MKIIIIDQAGQRLDKYICKIFDISFSLAQKLIREKKIIVNDKKVIYNYKLQAKDKITIFQEINKRKITDKKSNITIKQLEKFKNLIIFEDDNLMAINKPSGLASQLGDKIETSVDCYIKELSKNTNQKLALAHRLDKDTSGILLVTKNKETSIKFFDLFKTQQIKKTYIAVADGVITKKRGVIDISLSKKIINNLEKVYKDEVRGKKSITEYEVIEEKVINNKTLTLIKAYPLTGRTHQIRVHLKEISCPIVNDVKYGGPKIKEFKRMCLHSSKILIKNYYDDKNLEISCDKVDFLDYFMNDINLN